MAGAPEKGPCRLLNDEETGAQLESMLAPRTTSCQSVMSCSSPRFAALVRSRYRGLCCKAALGTAVLLACMAAAICTVTRLPAEAKAMPHDVEENDVTRLVGVPGTGCAQEGQDCHTSKCCADGGGSQGLQCWAKDDYWAVCLRNTTCKSGVHPGETHGSYDQYGKFHLDSWSCEKLGSRSKPDCSTYGEDDCPKSRCDWFRTNKCLPKCSQFGTKEACPGSHCAWDGSTCAVDPCSAQWEDCRSSKCCSSARGAGGQQCFQKNKDYATCMDFCDSNSTQKGWSCKKLGERTPLPAPCSWAGKDCSATHCCANIGFSCVVKDDTWQACVQTVQHSTWVDTPVAIPEGWKGTVLGKWRSEYPLQPAAMDAPLAGVSFYCFMAVLPNSTEEALMGVAKKNGQGIFACNASAVFHSWKSSSAGWDTGEATLQNTAVFFKVWDEVKADGRYVQYDWTIKSDADCAFLPDRLRSHLWNLRVPAGASVYIKNTNADKGLSNGQFLGAIEIFSKKAVMTYFDNAEGCQKALGTNSGEDGFLKGCMDALGVGFMHDGEILKPDFAASYCRTAARVAYHPLKDPAVLQNCYNAALGKPIDWSHNTAPGIPR